MRFLDPLTRSNSELRLLLNQRGLEMTEFQELFHLLIKHGLKCYINYAEALSHASKTNGSASFLTLSIVACKNEEDKEGISYPKGLYVFGNQDTLQSVLRAYNVKKTLK